MLNQPSLRISDPEKEGALLTSKAIKLPVLLDTSEMQDLLQTLKKEFPNLAFFHVQGVCEEGKEAFSLEEFLEGYDQYVSTLKRGEVPSEKTFRALFSAGLSQDASVLYAMIVGEKKRLVKAISPLVQVQPHAFHFSKEDQSFRSMTYGVESITWGVQFSYPQLYQDPHTHDIVAIKRNDKRFPNTSLFDQLRKWIRHNTLPTPFLLNGVKKNDPMRLGKKAFSWISHHIQLKNQGIQIENAS